MNKVRKAVIPVAGVGSRFLPITKVIPKEMLSIGSKPIIHYLVEEAVASGITDIIFVLSRDKEMIRHYFSEDADFLELLKAKKRDDIFDEMAHLPKLARFHYSYQHTPKGDGDALLQAEGFIDNEPFLVLFGDDIVQHCIPAARQLIDHFKGESLIAVTEIPKESSRHYGIVGSKTTQGPCYAVDHLIEKPHPDKAPSNLGIIGKYVCSPGIFKALHETQSHTPDGELRLIDGFIRLKDSENLWALKIEGKRFDTGRPEGLLAANQAYANTKNTVL